MRARWRARLTGRAISLQTFHIGPKILEWDALAAARPRRGGASRAGASARLAPAVGFASKKTARGAGQRIAALARWLEPAVALPISRPGPASTTRSTPWPRHGRRRAGRPGRAKMIGAEQDDRGRPPASSSDRVGVPRDAPPAARAFSGDPRRAGRPADHRAGRCRARPRPRYRRGPQRRLPARRPGTPPSRSPSGLPPPRPPGPRALRPAPAPASFFDSQAITIGARIGSSLAIRSCPPTPPTRRACHDLVPVGPEHVADDLVAVVGVDLVQIDPALDQCRRRADRRPARTTRRRPGRRCWPGCRPAGPAAPAGSPAPRSPLSRPAGRPADSSGSATGSPRRRSWRDLSPDHAWRWIGIRPGRARARASTRSLR